MSKVTHVALLCALVLATLWHQAAAYYNATALVPATVPAATDYFGTSVASLGNLVAVGQPQCYIPYPTSGADIPEAVYVMSLSLT